MKKLILSLTVAALVTSCGGHADKTTPTDTPNGSASAEQEQNDIARVKKEMMDSISLSTIKQRTIDSMNNAALLKEKEHKAVGHHPIHHSAGNGQAPVLTPAPTEHPQVAAGSPTVQSAPTAAPTATVAKKKGLNNAAKGALIGLGTGAAAGAIIDKNNRGQGAILGGILGAAGGAVGGAVIDKNKRKKAQQDSINAANLNK